jgi:hypothetical protein
LATCVINGGGVECRVEGLKRIPELTLGLIKPRAQFAYPSETRGSVCARLGPTLELGQ